MIQFIYETFAIKQFLNRKIIIALHSIPNSKSILVTLRMDTIEKSG